LKVGLGAVAVSGSGCATLAAAHPGMNDADLDGFLGSLDAVMGRLASEPILERYFAGREKDVAKAPRFEQGQDLARKTLRSLFLVGSLRELPEERLAHPGVQQRLRDSMAEFDEALFGMTDLLDGLTPTERGDVAKVLRDDPDLGMRLMGALDAEASAWGVSNEGRLKLRRVATQATTRLKQSPDAFITEYVDKMNKLAARHGVHEQAQRELATSVGEALLWQGENPPEQEAAGGATTPAGLTPPPPPPPPLADVAPAEEPPQPALTPAQAAAARRQKTTRAIGTSMLTAGGIALGVGLVAFGLGFVAGSSGAGLFLFTVGAIVGISGLLVLLIGLIVYLASL
jgi:hypothetical protein